MEKSQVLWSLRRVRRKLKGLGLLTLPGQKTPKKLLVNCMTILMRTFVKQGCGCMLIALRKNKRERLN